MKMMPKTTRKRNPPRKKKKKTRKRKRTQMTKIARTWTLSNRKKSITWTWSNPKWKTANRKSTRTKQRKKKYSTVRQMMPPGPTNPPPYSWPKKWPWKPTRIPENSPTAPTAKNSPTKNVKKNSKNSNNAAARWSTRWLPPRPAPKGPSSPAARPPSTATTPPGTTPWTSRCPASTSPPQGRCCFETPPSTSVTGGGTGWWGPTEGGSPPC
mmetsp:Transcript_15309/g.34300  ORF Transcript_15309/g.34300 Transcript_15309/m.34300 type:complete len:211 (+) Transcript_15309:246-878(+)